VVGVTLERQSIEKKDFPIGRRGYDPDAVDSHLKALADEVDAFKHSSQRRTETLASSVSERVRAIVEAAENSASDIQRQAEEDAREIRAEANSDAQATREQAASQARDYVGRVSESAAAMLQRLDAMESELGTLLETLRTGANRLSADMQLLEGNLSEVGEAASPRPRFEPEAAAPPVTQVKPDHDAPAKPDHEAPAVPRTAPLEPAAVPPSGGVEAAVESESEPEVEFEEAEPLEVSALEPSAAPEARSGAAGSDDHEGARLIALNMALNGTPREETERYLAENFHLTDRRRLLDDVYASVGG
jgi:DivIVA domain-containing protein